MRLILIPLLLISTLCFSQKKDSIAKKDSVAPITDSTLFISLKQIARFDQYLKDKFTVIQYEVIMRGLEAVIRESAAEYQKKSKPK